jgi:hypothetical protein
MPKRGQPRAIAGASAVTRRSMAAHARARACGSVSTSAACIARLTDGSSSCDWFELPCGRILAPLKSGLRIVSGSAKSRVNPPSHMSTRERGLLQIVNACVAVTRRKLTRMPIRARLRARRRSLSRAAGSAPVTTTIGRPRKRPERKPARRK